MSTAETPQRETEPQPAAASRACPRCAAELRPDQEWCLACGTAVATRVERAPGLRLPLALLGVIVLLGLGALGVALATLANDQEQVVAANPNPTPTPAPTVAPAVTPTPTPLAGTDGATTTTPAPGATPGAEGTPSPEATIPPVEPDGGTGSGADGSVDDLFPGEDGTQGPAGDGGGTGSGDDDAGGGTTGSGAIADWPAGEDAYTVVLFSGTTRAEARERAQELGADGTPVGVLDSDDFTSLRPGYWVVFSGQYDSTDAAQQALQGLGATADGAYVRQITPR